MFVSALTICAAYFGQLGDTRDCELAIHRAGQLLQHFTTNSPQAKRYDNILKRLSKAAMVYINSLSQCDPVDRRVIMTVIFGLDAQYHYDVSGTNDTSAPTSSCANSQQRNISCSGNSSTIHTSPKATGVENDTRHLTGVEDCLPLHDISSLSADGSNGYHLSSDRTAVNYSNYDDFARLNPSLDLLDTASLWEINWDGTLL